MIVSYHAAQVNSSALNSVYQAILGHVTCLARLSVHLCYVGGS